MAENLSIVLSEALAEVRQLSTEEMLEARYQRFRNMGMFFTGE
jgi:acetyl-CoA carboxylase alpha subunit